MASPQTSPGEPAGAAPGGEPAHVDATSSSLTRRALVHELRVHQIELEQQNEELRRVQGELAAARDRYVDLFEFAPVGYLALDRSGRVTEANRTAAAEFGIDLQALLGSPFDRRVAPGDSDRWQRLMARAFRRGAPPPTELELVRADGRPFHAQLNCRRVQRPGVGAQLRVTLTDLSLRHLAERNRRIARTGSAERESERRAMARRLHEDLGQRLAALKMQFGMLMPGVAEPVVTEMSTVIDQSLALVRRMSVDLHPAMLEELGLNAALDWLIHDVAARCGLRSTLHLDDAGVPMEGDLAIAVYRLAETALEHLATYVDDGIGIELLRRRHDWVLQFQSEPGHARGAADAAETMAMTQSFDDQVHLLGARVERSELPRGIRRLSVFIPALTVESAIPTRTRRAPEPGGTR